MQNTELTGIDGFEQLSQLQFVDVSGCKSIDLSCLAKLPPNCKVYIGGRWGMTTPDQLRQRGDFFPTIAEDRIKECQRSKESNVELAFDDFGLKEVPKNLRTLLRDQDRQVSISLRGNRLAPDELFGLLAIYSSVEVEIDVLDVTKSAINFAERFKVAAVLERLTGSEIHLTNEQFKTLKKACLDHTQAARLPVFVVDGQRISEPPPGGSLSTDIDSSADLAPSVDPKKVSNLLSVDLEGLENGPIGHLQNSKLRVTHAMNPWNASGKSAPMKFQSLPRELQLGVFEYLPVRDLAKTSWVCKPFRQIADAVLNGGSAAAKGMRKMNRETSRREIASISSRSPSPEVFREDLEVLFEQRRDVEVLLSIENYWSDHPHDPQHVEILLDVLTKQTHLRSLKVKGDPPIHQGVLSALHTIAGKNNLVELELVIMRLVGSRRISSLADLQAIGGLRGLTSVSLSFDPKLGGHGIQALLANPTIVDVWVAETDSSRCRRRKACRRSAGPQHCTRRTPA